MPEASKSDLVFNKQTLIINVPIAFDSVKVQTIVDASREYEDDLENIDVPIVIEASGKDDIDWNFTKFLVDGSGKVVKRFEPMVTPEEIEPAIVAALG